MHDSIRALLTELVDYAGLFPPAALPLDPAIRYYAQYRAGADAWMLGRFICPAAKLVGLEEYRDGPFSVAPPTRFSVLGRGGDSVDAFRAGLQQDLADIAAFRATHGERIRVDAYETRLPAALTRDVCTGELVALLGGMRDAFSAENLLHIPIAAEIALGLADRQNIENAVSGLSFFNFKRAGERPNGDAERIAFKLRCGGTDAGAFPAVEIVAFAIARCRETGVPMKFTAGLHHPIRVFHDSVQTKMHGFLNVFGASVLAHVHVLSETRLRELLADENPASFRFEDGGFAWKNLNATTSEIAAARGAFATSFGSCSFDEPREDLRALRLL